MSIVIQLIILSFQQLFKHLPRQRKLSDSEKKGAENFLNVKANKKILQHKLSQETGKAVTLKDITNLQSSLQNKSTRNNLEASVEKLTDTYGKCHAFT